MLPFAAIACVVEFEKQQRAAMGRDEVLRDAQAEVGYEGRYPLPSLHLQSV